MEVARYDYPAQFADQMDLILERMRDLMLAGRYGTTDEVASFEQEFASFLGVRHVRGVNTGTDALIVALRSLGIGPGDQVVTQANTFNATVAAVCLTGATPVLVDARDDTYLIDETQLEAALTPRTRAVIPVHLFGKPTPMDGILELCRRHGLHVVEDAAQAHGARLDGRAAGTFGDIGCFSFHPSKNLASAGDGGAAVTDDDRLATELERRRALGQRSQNDHVVIGSNTRLHGLQAIVLAAKLSKLDEWNDRRRAIAQTYRRLLAGLPITFQASDANEEHVYHLFQLRTPLRDRLLEHLRAAAIDAVVRYPVPIHLQPAFSACGWRRGQFPVAERLARELICLPLHPHLRDDQVEFVAESVRHFFSG